MDKEIDVQVVDDATHEGDEAFRVELSALTALTLRPRARRPWS